MIGGISMRDKYLISTESLRDAKRVAERMNLKLNQWIHIPSNEFDRKRKLMGHRVSDEKYLIGFFTEEERMYLYPPIVHI